MHLSHSKAILAIAALSFSYVANSLSIRQSLPLSPRNDAAPECLRIMPLGASIVYGYKSDPPNGFRKPLRDHLTSLKHNVDMVGSQWVNSCLQPKRFE